MSWTTVGDLRMAIYQGNQTLDTTSFSNHATLLGSATSHPGYVTFPAGDAQLEMPVKDDSLARFWALRVQALVHPNAQGRRNNIAEGWMSFALFVEADGRLVGTIYDGQSWVGPDSGAIRVPAGQWSRVCFEYDGVSIATLTLDGAAVGHKFDMPTGMAQPQQVIALGHWPRGDGRYTLDGHLGHVRIERRDYQDIWHDAARLAFCRRKLTPAQIEARWELQRLLSTLSPEDMARLRNCAIEQARRMAEFMHGMRTRQPREGVRLRALGEQLRAAWCCSVDVPAARGALTEYLTSIAGQDGSAQRGSFQAMIEEFFAISRMCQLRGEPFDRMRELCQVLLPDLQYFELELRQIAKAAEEAN